MTPKENSTIYVIGNGPSLNKVDVTKLRTKHTISFNRAFIAYKDWGFDPTYYMCIDPIVLVNIKDDIQKLINESKIQKFFLPLWSKKYFGKSDKIQYLRFLNKYLIQNKIWGFSFNFLQVIANVGATSIPVLKLLGYKNAIILGTDCNYKESDIKDVKIVHNKGDRDRKIVYESCEDNDPNHFRSDYFGKGTEYSKPQTTNHFKGWEFIAGKNKKKGINILLCSPGSSLVKLFDEIDFEESFKI